MTKGAYVQGPIILIGTALAACLILGGVFAFVLRDQMLVHYHANCLVNSDGADPEVEEWLQARPLLTLPVLLPYLKSTDGETTQKCGEFVERTLAAHDDPTDPGDAHISMLVAAMLDEQYSSYSVRGCQEAVDLAYRILEHQLNNWSPHVATALETAGNVVLKGLSDTNPQIRQHSLERLNDVWTWNGADDVAWSLVREWRRKTYMTAVRQLKDRNVEIRKAAVFAIAGAPFHEGDAAIIDLLQEPEPTLRRAALLALARAAEDESQISAADGLTATQKELLIPFLHDEDPDVEQAARQLLLRSGVSEALIHLAKLMEHPVPAERAKVPALAFSLPDIAPELWVVQLADDPNPAVRLAVARAAATSKHDILHAKLEQMAKSDPDPLVRQMSQQLLAEHGKNQLR